MTFLLSQQPDWVPEFGLRYLYNVYYIKTTPAINLTKPSPVSSELLKPVLEIHIKIMSHVIHTNYDYTYLTVFEL